MVSWIWALSRGGGGGGYRGKWLGKPVRAALPAGVVALAAGLAFFVSLSAAASGAGSGWSVQPTRNPKRPNWSQFFAVSCASVNACIAVGNTLYDRNQRFAGLTERWNGSRWMIQPIRNLRRFNHSDLFGVSCVSASACIAVGDYQSGKTTMALAERWNGLKWAIQRMPNRTQHKNSQLLGISCASASACTAIGNSFNGSDSYAGGTLVERWNGRKWMVQPTPNPSVNSLAAVSCASANVCTAVGEDRSGTLAERWNGTHWTIQQTPNLAPSRNYYYTRVGVLSSVSCPSARACTAVGTSSLQGEYSSDDWTLAEHWNGTKWTIQQTPDPNGNGGNDLNGVSCASARACTAVGSQFSGTYALLSERWDGTRWTTQRTPNLDNTASLAAVSCASRRKCTAAGSYFDPQTQLRPLAAGWNG